jgi:hypothetical protein
MGWIKMSLFQMQLHSSTQLELYKLVEDILEYDEHLVEKKKKKKRREREAK